MPKLRKSYAEDQTQDSLTFEKYLAFQEIQTSIPQPINQDKQQQSSFQHSSKNKAASGKKSKRSLKKQKNNDSQEILQTQKTAKRKSRKKKVDQSPQRTEDQNQKDKQKIQSPKVQKKQRGLRKNNKSSKKSRTEQNQYHAINKNEDEFNGNQLRQKQLQNNETQDNKQLQKDELLNKSEQQKFPVNFNKRLRKKNQLEQQDLNVLLSRYAEDERSNAIGNRGTSNDDQFGEIGYKFQSDLSDLDLLDKKKEKKQKKEKQVKIKNKYFSNISMSESQPALERQDPPQNSEELIIEKKQPRKTIHNLNQVIEKRVNHIKDRREFKNSEGDIKFKNQLKNKLRQVKDVEEVQVDIEIPNLFTKKTVSAALYMKNTLQAEEKKTNFNKKNTQNQRKLQKTSSNSSLTDNKPQQAWSSQHKKNQQFMFQMKKKGVKREDFFDHLNKQIKNKRHTKIGSQQIKDCFKTSSLNEQNFDAQLADEALSNCSSRSNSQQSLNRFERLKRTDSKKNLKRHQQMKQYDSQKQQNKDSLTRSISRSSSKWNIEMNGNVENSNSKSFPTNRSSKCMPSLINPPISQVKQSDASSSVRQIEKSCSFGIKPLAQKNLMRFDGQQIKEEVQKSFQKTLKIFQSENQLQIVKNIQPINKDPEPKTTNEMLQDQKESDKNLQKKLKKIIKNTNQKKSLKKQEKNIDCIDDILGDNLNEENLQRHEKKKKKRQRRNKHKKTKQGFSPYDYESYFEVEAEYSSDEQGHSDSQCQSLDSDLDEEGNILGLIDKDTDGLQLNQGKVKRKFLLDEEKRDQQMIEKIMKGLYGRKKLEQTDSEKRLKKRMEQAAKKNLLEDLQEINGKSNHFQSSELCQNPHEKVQKIPQKQNQNDENSRQMRKLKEMEELLLHRGNKNIQNENFNSKYSFTNEAWKIINPSLPVRKTIIPSNISGKRVSVDKNKEHRKSIFDTKKGAVQQEIFNKTIQTDRQRADSTGNRNKHQKTSQIRLQIRNTNVKLDQDIQI